MQKDFGLHFILALSGTEITEDDRHVLSTVRPAGIFLDGDNFDHNADYKTWIKKLDKLITEAKKIINRENIIVSIDHEGGRVHRVPAPLTHFPYARCYEEVAAEVGNAICSELQSIGINMLFGPVVDIDSNPNNPVIGKRSFATTPEAVIDAAGKYIQSLSANNMLFALKHFPGHGDTNQDSHLELPSVDLGIDQLEQRELLPYIKLISDAIPAIMTAHVQFTGIDKLPATMSEKILTGILREKLKFNGVVISDDLDMLAIKNNFCEQQVCTFAIAAGCDMFLFNHAPERALNFLNYLKDCEEKDLLNSEARIKKLLTKIKSTSIKCLSDQILQQHQKIVDKCKK